MRKGLLSGALAGAAGTTVLNIVTYADMALRGRPASQVPEQTVEGITDRAGLPLGEDETAAHRRQALGALLGLGVGVGVGAVFGLVAARIRLWPATAAVGLGVAASVAGEAPATALGLTDPRTWGASGWLSDLVPHLLYGIVTAATYDGLTDHRATRCATRPR
jgi:xanthosine utilization system XapX-like protein